ncbi:MAG: hypothetical protein J1E41_04440 [Ruminococcus sp.]|nr:hypothetical protein [Ruminococcus sp.]
MKKSIKTISLVLMGLILQFVILPGALIGGFCACQIVKNEIDTSEYFDDSGQTFFVKTKNDYSGEVSYYESNYRGVFCEVEEFETNESKRYSIDNGVWYGRDGKPAENQKELEQIASATKESQDPFDTFEHQLGEDEIFVVNGEYYVSFWYNVNWQTPYGLFKYDEKENKLKEIFYISDEKIIGVRFDWK